MELLSVEYGDLPDLLDDNLTDVGFSACLRATLYIDPALVGASEVGAQIVHDLGAHFPTVRRVQASRVGIEDNSSTLAQLVAALTLDLQRDLCEWPAGSAYSFRALDADGTYELSIESIDERIGRFSAQLAVQVVRMMVLHERFDPHLIWLIDLVRHLRRRPRLRLSPRRVAGLLGCSRANAEWAIEELSRYGYLTASEVRRPRRLSGGRILVVDDSAQIRDLLSHMLEALSFDVVTAVNGEEGLILLDWSSYEAVFVDLNMPGVNGKAFLQGARTQGISCPIFVISGYGYQQPQDEVRALGATAFVAKPFSLADIESVLRTFLRKRKR